MLTVTLTLSLAGAAGSQVNVPAVGVKRVEQVRALDAEVAQAVRIELEKAFEGHALVPLGAQLGKPMCDQPEGIERQRGGSRPLARKHERHETSPFSKGRHRELAAVATIVDCRCGPSKALDTYSSNK